MRLTHQSLNSHHSHDANNANATRNGKGSDGFMNRVRSSRSGRVVLAATLAIAVLSVVAVSSNAAGGSFVQSVKKFFGVQPEQTRVLKAQPEALKTAQSKKPLAPTAVTLSWNTFGNLGTETTEPSTVNDPNVSSANLTLGSVTVAANGNRFGGSNWFNTGNTVAGNTLAEAIAGNDYIQFIVTPSAGFSFTPTSFVFIWDRSATGPSNVTLRSSADGFSTNLGTTSGIVVGAFATNTITISGLTNLTTATTFRLYGYGATGTGGTGGFDTSANATNVTLNGTTVAIPPALGTYSTTSVALSANTTVTPSAAPTDTTSISVLTNSKFKGTLTAIPATGVVTVTNAHPAGSYPVSVIASGPGGTTNASFTLNVTTPAACLGQVAFTSAADVASGSVNTVATGDFNNDGKQDLAYSEVSSSSVRVRLGNNDGTFGVPAIITVGANGYVMTAGDFNGDGKLDLATANSLDNTITVALGNGDGTFAAGPTVSGLTGGQRGIAAADMNGDGKLDLVTVGSAQLYVLTGNGAGGFSITTNFTLGASGGVDVAVGDITGDGKLDVVAAHFSGGAVSVSIGDGSGGISSSSVFGSTAPSRVTLGDVDNDGDLDLAIASGATFTGVQVRLNTAGSFGGGSDSLHAASSAAFADFNRDGDLDYVSTNFSPAQADVAVGFADGTFSVVTTSNVGTSPDPNHGVVGDFNNDGKQDFISGRGNGVTGGIAVRLGACNPLVAVTGGLVNFGNVAVGATSAEQTYTVSGSALTNDITVTAPSTDFQVSKTSGSGFASFITFTQSGGLVPNSTVFVHFTPQSSGAKSGNITNASTGATTQNVAVSGTGVEPDVTVSGGNLVITDANGGNTNDTLTISLNVANVRINDPNNTLTAGVGATQINPNTVEVPLASITGNIQVNTLLGDDTLTLALAGGDFIPAGGVSYDGGGQTLSDQLVITGGNQGTVTYNYANANDGSVEMSNFGTVDYIDLEPISNSGNATDVIFNLPTGSSHSATLSDLGGGSSRLASTGTFEQTDFANPTGSVTINGSDLNSFIGINALAANYPSLTINGGQGTDSVNFNGNITFAVNANLDVNLQNDDPNPGIDNVFVNNNSQVITSGTGTIDVRASEDIFVNNGGRLQTQNGNLTVEANLQTPASAGEHYGVTVEGGTIESTGSGNVLVRGRGGDGGLDPFDGMYGVFVWNSGKILSTGTGTITVEGTGGDRTSGPVDGDSEVFGVYVYLIGSEISSTSGAIQITGQGGATNDTSSLGVVVAGGKIQTSGAGTLTINGTGGVVTGGHPVPVDSGGVFVVADDINGDGGVVASTSTGNIFITGISGPGGAGAGQGLRVDAPGTVTSVDGSITLAGTGGACGNACLGTSIRGAVEATGTGAINITGTGAASTGAFPTHGVNVRSGGAVTTTSGNIAITGTGGNGTDSAGFNVASAGTGIVQTAGGTITVNADTIRIDPTANATIDAGTAAVSLRQKTNGVAINLGSLVDNTAATVELSDDELDRVIAGSLNIGNTSSGAITVSANITRTASTNMSLVSSGDVTISGGQVNTGGGTLFLDPGTSPAAVKPTNSGIDGTVSTLSFGSNLAIVINGTTVDTQYTQLNVAGSVNLTGVDLVLSGTHTPVAAQAFTIVNNDLADAITGTFNGLPEGATISNFLGSPLSASITYVGGSGNDVVLTVNANNVYTWNASVSSDWQIPLNWTPARLIPQATDILLVDFNSTQAPTITNIPTQTIAAFRVLNGAFVTLNAATLGQPHTLTINGATGADFTVPGGSFLTLDGSNGLTIELVGAGTIGTIGGGMVAQGSGFHRLFGDAGGGITFQTGASFATGPGLTSNPFGTGSVGDGQAGSVVFASGSTYSHNAGDSPFGTVGNGPVVTFQTGSLARWFSNIGFQASDRTYANLQISAGLINAYNVSDSGTGNFQFDNLDIRSTSSANSSLTYTGSGTASITIRGNVTSTGTGDGGTLPDLILSPGSGGTHINKNGGGTLIFSATGNSRAIDLEGGATIENGTTLSLSRVILLGLANPHLNTLTVNSTAGITGGSSGYVIGGVEKISMPTNFTFPVGTVGAYSPVDLANATSGDLRVAARTPQQPVLAAATSLQRYWTLTEGDALTADLTFHYLDPTDVGASNEANYRVVVVEGGNATNFPADANHSVDTVNNTFTALGVQNFSDWTAAEPAAPTAVKLVDFKALQTGNEVMLSWQTGYETRNLGYNVYREQGGRRVAITPSLVAGSALLVGSQTQLTAGLMYSWVDKLSNQQSAINNQKSPVTYWLEDVDLDGTRTLHGPIAIAECGMGNPDCKKFGGPSKLLDELGNQQSAVSNLQSGVQISGKPAAATIPDSATDGPDPMVMQRTIAALPGVKISITRAGWYRITQPQLLTAGLTIADANGLQLYRDGRQVAFRLSNSTEQFGASDYLEFYGEGLSSTTASAQTYYLVKLAEPGKRIELKGQTVRQDDRISPEGFAYTVERKERMIYFSNLLNGDKENFFGRIVSTSGATSTIPVSHLDLVAQGAGSLPQLAVVLQGVTSQAHQVQVRINGTELGTMSFANTDHPSQTFKIPAGVVQDGNNAIELTAQGGAADVSLIDVLRLTYVRGYEADNNALAFNLSSLQTKRIMGFTTDHIRVLDVSDSYNVQELTPDVTQDRDGFVATIGVEGEVEAPFSRPHELLIFADGDAQTVDAIQGNEASSWWSETAGADYLILTTTELKTSVKPLAHLRTSQGLVVKIIDVEDLYDENTFGSHSPQALRDFLAKATGDWTRKPRYVVFAGDASYDPKNYLGIGLNDLVPTKLIDTSLSETASDDWLADFNNDGMADFAIGRLPVATAKEMDALVAKIVNYESAVPDPSRGALLVSDNGFEAPSNAVQSLLPAGMTVATINRSSADDATIHNQIIAGINEGPRVINYIGHGSNGVWTGASLLSSNDAPNLTNNNRLAVFTMMTCYNGYFQDASNDSLSEALLKAPGGAVAVWASTTLTQPAGQNAINQEFYRMLFGAQPATLGDAARGAKLVTGDADVRRSWTLFGDPAMRLR